METEEELRPLPTRLIVGVNMKQKSDYEIELAGGVKWWADSNWGFDGKKTKPTIAKVYAVGKNISDIKVGDLVLCDHLAFSREISKGCLADDLRVERDGLNLFAIPYSNIECLIGEDGAPAPLKDKIIVERISNRPDTFLHIPETAITTEKNLFRALKVGEECDGVQAGDTIITLDYSDYEIHYTLDYKMCMCITVRYEYVLGIKH